MAVLGNISIIVILLCLLAVIVTGRKRWAVIWLWCVPIIGITFFVPDGIEINGLVVLISGIMMALTAYSLWGVKAWCISGRKKIYVFWAFLFAINFAVSEYYFYQCISLGYLKFLYINTDVPFIAVASVGISLYIAAIMSRITIIATDKYFSKKETFVLIQCQPLSKKRNIGVGQNKYAIKGVQNGQEYVFYMTRKAYFMLKSEKNLVMEVRRGIVGGIYVSSDLYDGDQRRKRRINRVLAKQCSFAILTVAVVVLFIARIKLGVSFDEIFIEISDYLMK